MQTLLIIYIIAINLIGFFIMGIDKSKARRNKWRVPEKTLFLIALAFGSIGILTGMYVFRHKTRHATFRFGIPAILILQVALIVLIFSWNLRRLGRPQKAVRSELERIQELDPDTIQAFVSYENLINSNLTSGTVNDKTVEAVSLFFKNFNYKIQQEQTDHDKATVTVQITNIDMYALAQDLCRAILEESVDIYKDPSEPQTDNYYDLLYHMLSSHTYETTDTTAVFHLQKDESGWVILADRALEDALVSGFISYINDPHILPVSEILSIHLDAFCELTDEQWKDYLKINDVFCTYNEEYAPKIDAEYLRQLAQAFDYEIIRCQEDGNTAQAVVRIRSIDMENVLSIYKEKLLAYAATTRSLRDDSISFSNETSRLLLEALQENDQTTATDITMTFHNNGTLWEIQFDDAFTNALMGDMRGAIDDFNEVTKESLIMNPSSQSASYPAS
ncbi:MAG: DUF1294 domain-containing protein [Lachnospiraceae bacterium]|uniref:DUF1294 domain-containing protein n=1 Tax=Parablautia sp. Marseille-Q6255 TaxID=3039593 RepID=UPI002F3E48B6